MKCLAMRTGWLRVWMLGLLAGSLALKAQAAGRTLYATGFEAGEGYQSDLTLVGQGGWVGDGSGGNGLVDGFLAGQGQHGFVGYTPPTTNTESFLSVWRPINYVPGPTNPPIVRASVLFSVEDSSQVTRRDDFRWSVYNVRGDRLFSLDFDNDALEINYLLDDDKFVSTGRTFTNSRPYRLEVVIRLADNRWSATLDGAVLATNLAVTTKGATLDFGDFDAVWAIRTEGSPGDNFMVFDDYRVTAEEPAAEAPPRLEPLGLIRPGEFLLRCYGTPGRSYVLQSTGDFRDWVSLKTNAVPADGYFDHLDRGGGAWRFYRARQQ